MYNIEEMSSNTLILSQIGDSKCEYMRRPSSFKKDTVTYVSVQMT